MEQASEGVAMRLDIAAAAAAARDGGRWWRLGSHRQPLMESLESPAHPAWPLPVANKLLGGKILQAAGDPPQFALTRASKSDAAFTGG